MSNIQLLKNQIQELTNRQIKLETLVEQAKKSCRDIELKYNIKNEQELKNLLDATELEYTQNIEKAQNYVNTVQQQLNTFEGLL